MMFLLHRIILSDGNTYNSRQKSSSFGLSKDRKRTTYQASHHKDVKLMPWHNNKIFQNLHLTGPLKISKWKGGHNRA